MSDDLKPAIWRFRKSRNGDLDAVYNVWHASVIATHDFLRESDFRDICLHVANDYFPNTSLLLAVDERDRVIGLMGTNGRNVESLFSHPAYHRKGLGRAFIAAAAAISPCLEVEVNAQNKQAVAFYEALGFFVFASSPVDGDGRPYPILRMRLSETRRSA